MAIKYCLQRSGRTAAEFIYADLLGALIRPHPEIGNEAPPAVRPPLSVGLYATLSDQPIGLFGS